MESPSPHRLLAMAVLRGLVDAPTLAECALCDDPIGRLRSQGRLDAEDIHQLEKLLQAEDRRSRTGSEDGPTGSEAPTGGGAWSDEDPPTGAARLVLSVQVLPQWRRFRNLRFLAQGGMGRVFKAWDPLLKRKVALKFLLSDRPELSQRFLLEAQHQARVEHPHVCPVFEAGEWQGQAYLCMPLLEGRTLEAVAPELSLLERVQVLEQVVDAVHEAHRSGLIHRDLKPSNLIVERTERGLHAMVLDFGLARGIEASGLTQQGVVLGTFHYMAPEQLRGGTGQPSRSVDVYGLGATLHKVFVGQAPFGDLKDLEALLRAAEGEVPSLRILDPALPEELDLITRKCLHPDPEQRYPTARALGDDLRRWREGEPVLARPPSRSYRIRKWLGRHRHLAFTGFAAGFAMLAMVGMMVIQHFFGAAQLKAMNRYLAAAEELETELRFAYLAPAHDVRPDLARARTRLAALEGTLNGAGRAERAPLHFAVGRGYLMLQMPTEARHHLERAWAAGLREPPVQAALEDALGLAFATRIASLRMDDADRRARLIEEAVREYRGQMQRLTGQAGRGADSPRSKALRALSLEEMAEAVAHAGQARRESPMVLENWLLEARIEQAWADSLLIRGDAQGEAHLQRAEALFAQGSLLARSHPDFLLGGVEVSYIRQKHRLNGGKGEPGEIRKALASMEDLFRLDPLSLRAWELKVSLVLLLSNWMVAHGQDGPPVLALLQETLDGLHQAVPEHRVRIPLLHLLAVRRGEWEMGQGLDPAPGFNAAIRELEGGCGNPETRRLSLEALAAVHQRRGRHLSWSGGDAEPDFQRSVDLETEIQAMDGSASTLASQVRQAYFLTWLAHVKLDKGKDPAGDLERGLKPLRTAAESMAAYTYVWRYLGIAWTLEGQRRLRFGGDPWSAWTEAQQALDRNLALNPHDASALACRGTLHVQKALQRLSEGKEALPDHQAALRDAEACFRMRPFMPELMLGIAELELKCPDRSRHLARARSLTGKVLAKYPRNPLALRLQSELSGVR